MTTEAVRPIGSNPRVRRIPVVKLNVVVPA
jgi:hypothetical protein